MLILLWTLMILAVEPTAYSLADSNLRSIENDLSQRASLAIQYENLAPNQTPASGPELIQRMNQLFIQAQKLRLQDEIIQLKKIESSFFYRGWEKQAASIEIASKEATLKMLNSLPRSLGQKPLQCLTDLSGESDLGSEATAWANSATHLYSKTSSFSSEGRRREILLGLDKKNKYAYLLSEIENASTWNKTAQVSQSIDQNSIAMKFIADRENQQIPAASPGDYHDPFDGRLSETERATLKKFGIQRWHPTSGCRDLSGRFSAPQLQPPHTAECAGYAIASDMEEELNQGLLSSKNHAISGEYAYAAILNGENNSGVPRQTASGQRLCGLIGAIVDPMQGVASMADSLQILTKTPVCPLEPHNLPDSQKKEYVIKNFQSASIQTPSVDFLKAFIDNGMTPVVELNSDRRKEIENWIYPNPGAGTYRHVVNLVGYCSGFDPNCMQNEGYFIVRDSLGQKSIHYDTPASDFVNHVIGVDKVTGVSPIQ